MNVRRSPGFTIMEMLVVLGIIALIMSMVGPKIAQVMMSGNKTATVATLGAVKNAIFEYQLEFGTYPKTLEHLVKNVDNNPKWKGPYIEGTTEVPADKWGNTVMYNKPPKVFGDKYKYFEILSYGEGGESAETSEYLHAGS